MCWLAGCEARRPTKTSFPLRTRRARRRTAHALPITPSLASDSTPVKIETRMRSLFLPPRACQGMGPRHATKAIISPWPLRQMKRGNCEIGVCPEHCADSSRRCCHVDKQLYGVRFKQKLDSVSKTKFCFGRQEITVQNCTNSLHFSSTLPHCHVSTLPLLPFFHPSTPPSSLSFVFHNAHQP